MVYQSLDRVFWLNRLECDPNKPVILWFSTLGSYHGVIPYFAETLSALCSDYNLVVKPHPFSWQQEPEYLEVLNDFEFTHIISQPMDNVPLLQLADFVLADYGALVFDSIYTDQRLLLLDHPEYPGRASKHPLKSDTEAWIRHFLPHFSVGSSEQIEAALEDPVLWQRQAQVRQELRPLFFAPFTGSSAAMAADHILKIYASL